MPGIARAVQYALRRFGIDVQDLATLKPFLGPPLRDSFMEFYGMSPEEADRAVAVSREYFVPRGMFENELYPGIPELLAATAAAGRVNVIATSKPQPFAERIAAHFGIDRHFRLISGSTFDGRRKTKADVIRHALSALGIAPRRGGDDRRPPPRRRGSRRGGAPRHCGGMGLRTAGRAGGGPPATDRPRRRNTAPPAAQKRISDCFSARYSDPTIIRNHTRSGGRLLIDFR